MFIRCRSGEAGDNAVHSGRRKFSAAQQYLEEGILHHLCRVSLPTCYYSVSCFWSVRLTTDWFAI